MPAKRRRLFRAGGVGLMSGGMLAAMIWLWSAHASQTALRLGAEIEQVPDEQVPSHLRRLTNLGNVALPELCASLASPRPIVADAASATLSEELARWELLPPRQASRKLAMLAELLARQASEPRHTSRWRLADLAERMLSWPTAGLREMPQIAAHCQRVLEAAATELPEPRLLHVQDARPLEALVPQAIPAVLTSKQNPSAETAEFIAPSSAADDRPRLLAAPDLLPADMSDARPIATAKEPAPERPETPAAPPQTTIAIRIQERSPPLEELNTIPLAELLHSADDAVAAAARAELARRGYPPLEIYLQERLTDPDPGARSRAASSLPAMPAMDARPWLLRLSRDESSEVRLVALTLMATSGESQMLRRVKEMAQSDADARVRSQAQRAVR